MKDRSNQETASGYWAVRMGEGGKFVAQAEKGNFIAIGWNDLGNLEWLTDEKADIQAIKQKLRNLYRQVYSGTPVQLGINTGQVLNFVREIKKGNTVMVPNPEKRKILMGKVVGSYEYKEDWGDDCNYPHRKKMEWIRTADRDNLSQKLKYSIGALLTVFNLSRHQSEIEELSIKRTARKATKEITGDKLIKAIIDKLTEMNPREFEEFISHLLNLTGFEAATTQYVGDKGIDIEGTLNAEGLANVALKVQVKRVKIPVGIREVQRMRGTLGSDDHGTIVTTSHFTKQALEEAESANKKVITLLDGTVLAEIILKYYDELDLKYRNFLGIRKKQIPLANQFFVIEYETYNKDDKP